MVDNQHRQIPGYRDLDQETIDLIKKIKQMEAELADGWANLMIRGPVRAVAQPDSPWFPPRLEEG